MKIIVANLMEIVETEKLAEKEKKESLFKLANAFSENGTGDMSDRHESQCRILKS